MAGKVPVAVVQVQREAHRNGPRRGRRTAPRRVRPGTGRSVGEADSRPSTELALVQPLEQVGHQELDRVVLGAWLAWCGGGQRGAEASRWAR